MAWKLKIPNSFNINFGMKRDQSALIVIPILIGESQKPFLQSTLREGSYRYVLFALLNILLAQFAVGYA
jgi:hypothetical protein